MKPIVLVCLATLLAACGNKHDANEPRTAAVPDAEAERDEGAVEEAEVVRVEIPDACTLLELDEVRLAAGWQAPAARDATVERSYQRSCNFVDSASPAQYVSVTVTAGGAKYADSAAFATAVGDGDGTLAHPAAPVTDFGFPVIETQMGEIFSLRGSTKQGIELTVSSPAPRITRELFVAALSRL
jgi:hypothetical protein